MQNIPLGSELGGYVIGEQIAEGGMGGVYLAFKPGSNDKVAVKVMLTSLTTEMRARQRFEHEIEAMQALEHPNIVPLYAHGEENGLRYFVMKLIRGQSLKELLTKRQFSPLDAWGIIDPMAQALDYAHAKNMIHRDIKPANILIESTRPSEPFNNPVYLADFGLSKTLGELSLTPMGFNVGTADYMAPEQILDQLLTPRSDIYSLGIVMYEVLCGLLPFRAKSIDDLMAQHLDELPPFMFTVNPDFPPPLDDVVLKALAKAPEERYETAGEFASAYADALKSIGEEAASQVYWSSE